MIKSTAILALSIVLLITSCTDNPTPKPRAYFRIDLPEKKYKTVDTLPCPFLFELPQYAVIRPTQGTEAGDNCWYDIYMPRFKGELYLTYKPINNTNTLQALLEDLHKTAYAHQFKAEFIQAEAYEDVLTNKFGLTYNIKGNVASPLQFCITDSTKHFLRGSLYFGVTPNKDSIAPVLEFIQQDIKHLMESLRWK